MVPTPRDTCDMSALNRLCLSQGLVTGMGDEVRLGRGFMFWGLTLELTEEGERGGDVLMARLLKAVHDALSVSAFYRSRCMSPVK